ncbi:MAG TPA: hypothetical protein VFU22_13145 [Roseiflexaceae bacterium]|nr:hypothetical protein [Roseiflexaceae bacterium]
MVFEEAIFHTGQRVRIISSDSIATIKAAFTLVAGYYDVCPDGDTTRRIVFETELEALDLVEDDPLSDSTSAVYS